MTHRTRILRPRKASRRSRLNWNPPFASRTKQASGDLDALARSSRDLRGRLLRNTLSYVSPLDRAFAGKAVGDTFAQAQVTWKSCRWIPDMAQSEHPAIVQVSWLTASVSTARSPLVS